MSFRRINFLGELAVIHASRLLCHTRDVDNDRYASMVSAIHIIRRIQANHICYAKVGGLVLIQALWHGKPPT